MNEINRNIKMKVTALSPLHIGCKEEIDPIGYVVDKEKKLNVIVLDRLIEKVDGAEKEAIINAVKAREVGRLRVAIKNAFDKIDASYCVLRTLDVSPEFLKMYEEKIGKEENALVFKAFVSSMGQVYVPGSSIKGALRTGIVDLAFNIVLKEEDRKRLIHNRDDRNNIEAEALKYMQVNHQGKRKPAIHLDPFKKLKIRDTILPQGSTMVCMMHNKNAFGKGIPVALEVVKVGTVFEVDVTVADYGESSKCDYFAKEKFSTTLKYWSDKVKKKAKNEFERIKNFKGFSSNEKNKLEEFYNALEKCDGYLNRIGFGSGYDFMTVESFRNMKDPVKGKLGRGWGYSKNIVEGCLPLGFIKIQLI